MPDIIPGNTDQTIAQILGVQSIANMYESTKVDWDKPPFVRIGDVFVSLTILGDNSWSYIPAKFKDKNFKVLAGRHGNIINPIDDAAKVLLTEESHGNDEVDPALDRQKAGPFKGRVEVVDVRADDFRTGNGLKAKITQYSKAGNGVILAWCYGLFTFFESKGLGTGEDVSDKSHKLHASWQKAVTMTVSQIVQRDWAWAA